MHLGNSLVQSGFRCEAWKLSRNPYITSMADKVRQDVLAETVGLEAYSRGHAFDDATQDRDLAHSTKNAGAAVSATKLKAQIAGHLDDRTQENNALAALAQLVEQVRVHGGDMPRGSLTLERDGSTDGYAVVPTPNPLQTLDD